MIAFKEFRNRLYYGWVVVATFFITGLALYGTGFSFGIFFKSIESAFQLNRAETSAILSVNLILAAIFAFVAGWALDKYGPRIVVLLMGFFAGLSLLLTSQVNSLWQIFITYSLLLAIGIGPIYVVPMSTISRWFVQKRGLAVGIAGSAAGLGMVVMAPLATYLISIFDWQRAYLLMGLIAWLIIIPLSRLLRGDPSEIGVLPNGAHSSHKSTIDEVVSTRPPGTSLLQVCRTKNFWLFTFVWIFSALCVFLIMTHLVPRITDMRISEEKAAVVLSLMGGAAIAGRVLMGIASDRIGRKLAAVACALLQVSAMLWLIWARDFWMFCLFALVFGFAYGGSGSTMAALISDTFDLTKIGAIFGLLEFGWGMGAALGPVIGGLIFDAYSSYDLAFLVGATGMLLSSLFIALIKTKTERRLILGSKLID